MTYVSEYPINLHIQSTSLCEFNNKIKKLYIILIIGLILIGISVYLYYKLTTEEHKSSLHPLLFAFTVMTGVSGLSIIILFFCLVRKAWGIKKEKSQIKDLDVERPEETLTTERKIYI